MRIFVVIVVAAAALFFIRLHNASGITLTSDSATRGHRLAEAWCKQCHAIGKTTARAATAAMAFTEIASQPSTTALSLKVFLRTSHPSMPNIVIGPDESDDLVNYILTLKRR